MFLPPTGLWPLPRTQPTRCPTWSSGEQTSRWRLARQSSRGSSGLLSTQVMIKSKMVFEIHTYLWCNTERIPLSKQMLRRTRRLETASTLPSPSTYKSLSRSVTWNSPTLASTPVTSKYSTMIFTGSLSAILRRYIISLRHFTESIYCIDQLVEEAIV